MRGVKGVVVDGRVRDIDELRADGLPVFARGLSILSAKPYTRPAALNVSVTLNGDYDPPIIINSNDIIVGDLNGVVCVPQQFLDQVLELIKKQLETDTKVKEDLLKGVTISEAFKRHRG